MIPILKYMRMKNRRYRRNSPFEEEMDIPLEMAGGEKVYFFVMHKFYESLLHFSMIHT